MKTTVHNDLSEKYNKGTILIHWLTALLILTLFPLGKYMSGLEPAEKSALIKVHALLGMLVFILTMVRSWLFFKKKRPKDLETGSKFNDKLAVWIHNIFYFLLFAIALSGIATMALGGYVDALQANDPTMLKEPADIATLAPHGILATVMMVLLALHILGVAKHYVLTKENPLKRIS